MIATIAAFIYISSVCWCYGSALLHLVSKITNKQETFSQSFIITCFTGLAVIGVLFTALSLFIPLGTIVSQIILVIPALLWAWKKRAQFLAWQKRIRTLKQYPETLLAAVFAAVLMILVMHAWSINHPDTIAYHAQNIQWIEQYPAVPGIANLYLNYGIQGSWFVLAALFSFSFTGTTALTFINAVVLIWFVVFVIQKINKGGWNGLLWLLLLVFSFWSYTQVRLTASSGSPDFIAVLYIWLTLYLFVSQSNNSSSLLLVLFLSFFAITIKLSALPCILLSLYAWFRYGKNKALVKIVTPLAAGILVLVPFLARNVISSGYLLFPSSFPDFFSADWKVSKETLTLTEQYITAYARTNMPFNAEKIHAVMQMKPTEWLFIWWELRSLADKVMIASVPVLLILYLFFYYSRKDGPPVTALIFSLIGIIFWFTQAPDPRFGFGFIIPFCGIILYLLIQNYTRIIFKQKFLTFSLLFFTVTTLAYTAYRFSNHFSLNNIAQPAGIGAVPYNTIDCNGAAINAPMIDCGKTPLPCTNKDCSNFMPRGKSIRDGFKAK